MKTVEYYGANGTHETYDKYTVDDIGVIRNKKTNEEKSQHTTKDGYKILGLFDNNGKQKTLKVHRIVASTFLGRPPTPAHTPDHKNRIRSDNTLDNIRWKDPSEQNTNREMPETLRSAFIVVRDGVEMTVKEWIDYLKDEKTNSGKKYTNGVIQYFAQRKRYGFSYKVFDDLPGEQWKEVIGSKKWEVSNKLRMKYKTKYAENVLDVTQISTRNGYPKISINGKEHYVHIVCFQAFNPEAYANMKPGELVRHEKDDRLDFQPEKLLVGTKSQNGFDAHDNGKFDGTNSARKPCVSYIEGVKEKEHISLSDAVRYLRENDWPKAIRSSIRDALNGKRKNGQRKTAYGRTWT
ncbi:HNH endonuclease [Paramecium bursaria Chlorella virus NY2A]|uniref:Uncharacterized protein B370L n=1 Tax=Paramecium bursaria Chlorella virus NY2A TaxID=46021 RepID=A7IWP5_PBCVN|nr:HNH endonuclease [Paramecium bursaria Chlorella virus NY2A]ABT14769.1 hypothetical protein NY2A_B370L [Paramecium bursaria Chlorella virus NY2A]